MNTWARAGFRADTTAKITFTAYNEQFYTTGANIILISNLRAALLKIFSSKRSFAVVINSLENAFKQAVFVSADQKPEQIIQINKNH